MLRVPGSANGCLSTHRAGKLSPFDTSNLSLKRGRNKKVEGSIEEGIGQWAAGDH